MNKKQLFLTFLKIGAFTFGGGYAMIAVLENELVEKGVIDGDEFLDMTAVAESTPGPIAVNIATYVGYRMYGIVGATQATFAICIPAFCIITLISLFFEEFQNIGIVAKAFKGIQAGVIYLIFSAGLKMFRQMKKDVFNYIIFLGVMLTFLVISFLGISFSSIWMIVVCGVLGLAAFWMAGSVTGGRK